MPNQYTKNTFATTYKDDWNKLNSYHKVLFNGGRALQARELNEMQSIIQAEISRLGTNLFKEGALVNPGNVTLNTQLEYVRLDAEGGDLTIDHLGKTITGATSGVQAKIIQVVPAGPNDPPTIFVLYNNTSSSSGSNKPVRFTPGEILTSTENNLQVELVGTSTKFYPVGTGCEISVAPGDFFIFGHFVHVPMQKLVLSKYNSKWNGTVGFRVIQDIVTVADATNLYDNQGGTPNLSSPGADRYRIRMIMQKREMVPEDETFVFLCKVLNGNVVSQSDGSTDYNKINDLLAKRTFEESGNYVVKPFIAKFEVPNAGTSNQLYLRVSEGVAYVQGYRAESPAPKRLLIPKPQQTINVTDEQTPVAYKQYVMVRGDSADANRGLPDIYSTVTLKSNYNFTGDTIGTAKVRAVEIDGANYRVQLFDITASTQTFDLTNNFRLVRSIGNSSTDYFNVLTSGTPEKAVLVGDKASSEFFFPLPKKRPERVGTTNPLDTNIAFTVQRRLSGTSNTSGELTLTLSGTEDFTDLNSWLVASADSAVRSEASVSLVGGNTQQAVISGLMPSTSYEALTFIDKSNASSKTKTLTNTTVTGTIVSVDSDFSLGLHDVFRVNEIKDSANGVSIFDYFLLDPNITSSYYGISRLLNEGRYTGDIYVDLDYFARGVTGDFYSVSSYVGIPYAQIPTHKFKGAPEANMRNVLDFRPDLNANGTLANAFDPPKNATNITADVSYYLPRADKLCLKPDGQLTYLRGIPGENPQFRKTPEDYLELYRIIMNANTLSPKDVKMTQIEHKHYTMADIGKLERKVDRLEEVVSLNLLEVDTKNQILLSADGTVRTKSGFFVDNYVDQVLTDTRNPENRSSLDLVSRLMRPSFRQDNIRLIPDMVNSHNIKLAGDNVYLNYREVKWNSVEIASQIETVNPYLVPTYTGVLTLSPASDDWKDVEYEPDKIIDGGTRLDTTNASKWNEHEWSWGGIPLDELEVGAEASRSNLVGTSQTNKTVTQTNEYETENEFIEEVTNTTYSTTTTQTAVTVNRIVAAETVKKQVGNRVLYTDVIPWCRSKKISFKAEGLRPNTRVYPYFDGKRVDAYCRQEDSFVRYSQTSTDYGNIFHNNQNQQGHPDGYSDLYTDDKGSIKGSFLIPNRAPKVVAGVSGPTVIDEGLRFRTGSLEFKLLDISKNNNKDALCRAEAIYTAAGVLEKRQRDVLSTRVLVVEGSTEIIESSTTTTTTNTNTNTTAKPTPPVEVPVVIPQQPDPEPDPTYAMAGANVLEGRNIVLNVVVTNPNGEKIYIVPTSGASNLQNGSSAVFVANINSNTTAIFATTNDNTYTTPVDRTVSFALKRGSKTGTTLATTSVVVTEDDAPKVVVEEVPKNTPQEAIEIGTEVIVCGPDDFDGDGNTTVEEADPGVDIVIDNAAIIPEVQASLEDALAGVSISLPNLGINNIGPIAGGFINGFINLGIIGTPDGVGGGYYTADIPDIAGGQSATLIADNADLTETYSLGLIGSGVNNTTIDYTAPFQVDVSNIVIPDIYNTSVNILPATPPINTANAPVQAGLPLSNFPAASSWNGSLGVINPSLFNTAESFKLDVANHYDPVAQTFMVDNDWGVFLTKVTIYFATKDAAAPVSIQIRPTVQGAPASRKIVPGSEVTVAGADVNAVLDVVDNPTLEDVLENGTDFEFEEPIFLSPWTEYAIIVKAPNSLDYRLFVSEIEQFVVGSTSRRVTKQPSLGSFFKSQNAKLWEPDQRLDMMYTLHRAQFVDDGFVKLRNAEVPLLGLKPNPLQLTEGSREIYVRHPNHGLIAGELAYLYGLDSDERYGGILGSSIMGGKPILEADYSGFVFQADSAATSSAVTGGSGILSERHMQYNLAQPKIHSISPKGTSITTGAKLTSGRSYAGSETRFVKDTDYFDITPDVNREFETPRMVANRRAEVAFMGSQYSVDLKVGLAARSGSGYAGWVSPVVDLQRTSFIAIENIIDNPVDGIPSLGENAPIDFVAETHPSKGTAAAKHISAPVSILEDATGIKVLFGANVPPTASFDLYYRTTYSGSTPLEEVSWVLAEPEEILPKDKNPNTFREYNYLIGGTEGTLTPFTEFQFKIVMKSSNTSKVPKFRDFRAIAMID